MNKGIEETVTEKQKLYVKYLNSPTPIHEEEYKRARNQTKDLLDIHIGNSILERPYLKYWTWCTWEASTCFQNIENIKH